MPITVRLNRCSHTNHYTSISTVLLTVSITSVSNTLMHNLLRFYTSSSGIDGMLCCSVFSDYYSVVKHIVNEFAASKFGKIDYPCYAVNSTCKVTFSMLCFIDFLSYCIYLSSCLSRVYTFIV